MLERGPEIEQRKTAHRRIKWAAVGWLIGLLVMIAVAIGTEEARNPMSILLIIATVTVLFGQYSSRE